MIKTGKPITIAITRQEAILIEMALQYSAEQITKWLRMKDRPRKDVREMLRLSTKQVELAKDLAKQIEEARTKQKADSE